MELPLSKMIDRFITAKKTEGLSPKTLSWYAWLLGKFAVYLDDPPLSSVTVDRARDFIGYLQDRSTR